MDNKEILYKLIKYAFEKKVLNFQSNNERELMVLIIENGLVGLVFNAIDKDSFTNQQYYETLKKVFGGYVLKDIQQMHVIRNITSLFNENNIQHVFLKGSHLKELYPESYMRGMGDIDVLVSNTSFDVAKGILQTAGYKLVGATSHHHEFQTEDHQMIELHQSIVSKDDYDTAFLSAVWDHVIVSPEKTSLAVEYEYLYILIHLSRHLRTSGIGIRSILDIWVFLNAYDKTINPEKIQDYLHQNKLTDFNNKVMHLNDIFLDNAKPSDEDNLIIEYIATSGIHGSGSNHDLYITKRAYEASRQKKGRFRYFLAEVFPKREQIQEAYPYLKKHPWLLPFAWLSRIFKQIFKRKNSKKRLKAITNDVNIDKATAVYDYFGI